MLAERRLQTLRELAAHASDSRTVDGACERAAATLAGNTHDLPFALLYLLDGDGRARLVGWAGCDPDHPAAPAVVDSARRGRPAAWPLADALREGRATLDTELGARVGPCHGGPFPEPVDAAAIVPFAPSGAARGVLVAGISPRRAYDASYQTFFELVAAQIATSVSNAARLRGRARARRGAGARSIAPRPRSSATSATSSARR